MPSWKALGLLVLGAGAGFHLSDFSLPTDMVKSPGAGAIQAPAPGALTVAAEAPLSRDDAGERLANPLPATPETLARGGRLYDIYCTHCHGKDGGGGGPAGKKFAMPMPPLADPAIAGRPDGYVYGTIRDGGFVMPSHAEVMSPEERWAVVRYLRSLQKR